jgi:hypothetical protein
MQAMMLAEHSVDLLSMCSNLSDAELASMLCRAGGVGAILKLLSANLIDPETVTRIMGILQKAALSGDQDLLLELAAKMKGIEETGRLYLEGMEEDGVDIKRNDGIVGCCISIMHDVASGLGADPSNITRDGMRTTMIAIDEISTNSMVCDFGPKLAEIMQSKFSDEPIRLLDTRMETAMLALDSLGAIIMLIDPDTGKPYYYNTETGETFWDAPPGFEEAYAAVMAMADAAGKQEADNIPVVSEELLKGLLKALQAHALSSDMAEAIANTLATLGLNGKNLNAIVENGGIEAIIEAIRQNPNNRNLLLILLTLLERISRQDQYKERIAVAGGVQVVLDIAMALHIDHEQITLKSLSILANLALNNEPNIDRIMDGGGVKHIEAAMNQWETVPRPLENSMCALSNLMHGSDENKLIIGKTCGDEIVRIVAKHHQDINLFKMALRALGNLSFCDENIEYIAKQHHATREIVKGMHAHSQDEECLQLSMEVIGNFASLEEDEDAIEEDADYVTMCRMIYNESGSSAIMKHLGEHKQNSAVLKSALNAMANICNDVDVTDLVAEHQRINPLTVEVFQLHDWDEEIIATACPLVAALTYSDICVAALLELDIVSMLLQAMDT